MKFLGSSKISSGLRVSLIREAAELLQVDEGDHVLYYVTEDGKIILKKG